MKKKIIVWDENWTDEFDIFGFSIVNEILLIKIIEDIKLYPEYYEDVEFYFGTNEAINFIADDLIYLLNQAQYISEEKEIIIKNLFFGHQYIDDLNNIYEVGNAFFGHLFQYYIERENEN